MQKIISFSGFKIEPYGMGGSGAERPASALRERRGGMVNAVASGRPPRLYSGFVSYGSFSTVTAGVDVGDRSMTASGHTADRPLPRRRQRDGLFAERSGVHRTGAHVAARRADLADHPGQLSMGQAGADHLGTGRRRRLSCWLRPGIAELFPGFAGFQPVRRQSWFDRLPVQSCLRRSMDGAPKPPLLAAGNRLPGPLLW